MGISSAARCWLPFLHLPPHISLLLLQQVKRGERFRYSAFVILRLLRKKRKNKTKTKIKFSTRTVTFVCQPFFSAEVGNDSDDMKLLRHPGL